MAAPIYVRTKELVISDAQKASSCLEDAISAMNKVDNAVLDVELYVSSDNKHVFEKSEKEVDACLSALCIKQKLLDNLISVMQTGTEKIENTDAGFRNELVDANLCKRFTTTVGRAIYTGGIAAAGLAWLSDLFSSSEAGNAVVSQGTDTPSTQKPEEAVSVSLDEYSRKATDAEYARLCQIWYDALDTEDKNPKEAFIDLIRGKRLPANDPLGNIDPSQVTIINSENGLDVVVIGEGDTAIVIFAGTDFGTPEDVLADVMLASGIASPQEKQAVSMIESLSEQYPNIVVTGHSLGGYLATAVTLKNSSVSQCIAFDPPGRYDAEFQNLFNRERVAKITTYEAMGSPVSDGLKLTSRGINQNVGNVINIRVSGKDNWHRHGIKEIGDALGGEKVIRCSWS